MHHKWNLGHSTTSSDSGIRSLHIVYGFRRLGCKFVFGTCSRSDSIAVESTQYLKKCLRILGLSFRRLKKFCPWTDKRQMIYASYIWCEKNDKWYVFFYLVRKLSKMTKISTFLRPWSWMGWFGLWTGSNDKFERNSTAFTLLRLAKKRPKLKKLTRNF